MRTPFIALALLCAAAPAAADEPATTRDAVEPAPVPPALAFTMQDIDGNDVELARYLGKVVLFVNVASKCGLTPQYEQLQTLHELYADRGLAVVAFPCNQFKGQEPGTAEEIKTFCTTHFGVTFDLMAKVDVNGESACPLYEYLKSVETGPKGTGEVSWNFEKFLIARDGSVVGRFDPRTRPDAEELVAAIETQLAVEFAAE